MTRYDFGPEQYMTAGDYHDYSKALEALALCARVELRNPAMARQLRHTSKETLRNLSARYDAELTR